MGCQTSAELQASQIMLEDGDEKVVDRNSEKDPAGFGQTGQSETSKEITFLFLGISESGKTTIYKMLRNVFTAETGPPSMSEKQMILKDIKKYVFESLLSVIKAMKSSDIDFERGSNQDTATKLLQLRPESFESSLTSLAGQMCGLWNDRGFIRAFRMLDDKKPFWNLPYYIDKLTEITGAEPPADENNVDTDYGFVPSDQDMSRIHASTISIHSEKVTVRGIYQCRLVDVGGLREERTTKWAQCFRNTSAVMYVIDCSAFDINLAEDSNKNRLLESLECFELLVSNRFLQGLSFVLFLNKQDVLLEKICKLNKRIYSRSTGFVGYSGFKLDEEEEKEIEKTAKFIEYPVEDLTEYFKTRAFIKHMFETVFDSVRDLAALRLDSANELGKIIGASSPPSPFFRKNRTYQRSRRGHVFPYYIVAVEPDSVAKIFPDAVSNILKEYVHNAKLL